MLKPTENFIAYLSHLQLLLTQKQINQVQHLAMLLPDWQKIGKYSDIGTSFISESKQLRKLYGDEVISIMNKLLLGTHACALSNTIKKLNLTSDILSLYPSALQRLENSIMAENTKDYCYPTEYYLKDLRFVTGSTMPCGAMVLDLRSIIGWKLAPLVIKNARYNLLRFMQLKNTVPWFRSHLELRYLDEFNEKGMKTFYGRVADLLKTHNEVHGLVSASWFYDPKLENISPHLGYLRQTPLENGALIIRGSTSRFDIVSATAKSRTRRQKYKENAYKPTCCLLIWPRDALLRWYDKQK